MKLKLAYYGEPILRQKALPVEKITQEILDLIEAMFQTMSIEDGIGLAAPQVHHSLRLFITHVPIQNEDESWDQGIKRVFINPTILSFSEDTDIHEEACLSIPGVSGDVERPTELTVEALDENGNTFKETFYGLEARCILHENDHINGKLFIDRMTKNDRKNIEKVLRKVKKA
jgi:peptide deformylase